MKIPRIVQSVGYIDDDLIESAANASISVRRLPIRRLVYVAICAIIAIIACLTVYAISSGTDWFVPREGAETPPNDDIPAVKVFVSPEGEEYFLRYDSTRDDLNGFSLYSYTDDHGNYYYYNKNGDFVKSWHNNDDYTILDRIKAGEKSLKVSKDDAKAIAEKYLLACHGEEFFDKFELVEISAADDIQNYYVKYSMLYGKDSFIRGRSAAVGVRYDGVVFGQSITNPENYEGFNFEILDDISSDDIRSFIEDILNEKAYLKYTKDEQIKGFEGYEIVDVLLGVYEGKYCIHIGMYVQAEWIGSSEYTTAFMTMNDNKRCMLSLYYPLENK